MRYGLNKNVQEKNYKKNRFFISIQFNSNFKKKYNIYIFKYRMLNRKIKQKNNLNIFIILIIL